MGLILYNGPQCANASYAAQFPLVDSLYWDQGWGAGVLSCVAGASSRAFYDDLFARLAAQGMSSFTQDFLDFQGLLFPAFLQDAAGNAPWMAGQADAALAAGIAVQYCMALPADILQSSLHPAVTNARASQDYGVGSEGSWMIAGSSLLLSALGMRASKDNFATGAATDRGQETSPFLSAAVCALSGGPVGFSDALFATNPAVLWPTTALDGTLLHASRPATSLDQQFAGAGPLAAGDVRAAHSAVYGCASVNCVPAAGGVVTYSVLAATAQAADVPALLQPADLYPSPVPGGLTYLLFEWNSTSCATNGADATDCVSLLGAPGAAGLPPPAAPKPDRVPWRLHSAVPLMHDGYALLGEVGKFVPVSPARFALVQCAGFGITVGLRGAPGEAVDVAWIAPGEGLLGTVYARRLVLGGDGTLTTLLETNLVAAAAALPAAPPLAAPPSPPCYSPLNADFETPCYATVAHEGVFSLRDYAPLVGVTVVTALTSDGGPQNAAFNVLTYFTGTNLPGINVTRTVPLFFRPRFDGEEILASMALPTSLYPDPSVAPIPEFPNDFPGFQQFPKTRFAAITFQTATSPGIIDFATACGELDEEIIRRGLTPVGASLWNITWATYSLQASSPKQNECLVEVEVT